MRTTKSRWSWAGSMFWTLVIIAANLSLIHLFVGMATNLRGADHAVVATGTVAVLTFILLFAVDELRVALWVTAGTVVAGALGALAALLVNAARPPAIFEALVTDPTSATANGVSVCAAMGAVWAFRYVRRYLAPRITSRS